MPGAGQLGDVSDKKSTIEFIEAYRSLPALWNTKSEAYWKKHKKNQAYDILLQKYREKHPNAEKCDVTRKINTLRSNFRREMKRLEFLSRNGAGILKPNLWYYDLFSFVKECSDSSCQGQAAALNNEEQTEEEDEPSRKKPKHYNASSDHIETDFEMITEIWASKLKQMTLSQQLYAEKFINDIIFEGTLGTLTRNSVQINIYSNGLQVPDYENGVSSQYALRRDSVSSSESEISSQSFQLIKSELLD